MIFKKAFYASANVQSERLLETIFKIIFFETWVFELILRDLKEKVLFPFQKKKLNIKIINQNWLHFFIAW